MLFRSQIEVTLDIDANGILQVSAKDNATGKENKIRIEGGSQLSKEEIDRMRREAEENAEADRVEKERVEKLNQADSVIFQTEKQIKEFDDKLSQDEKDSLNSILSDLKEAHKSENLIKIDEGIEKLNNTWSEISSNLYQNQEKDDVNGGPDDTEEAEFEEL